VLQYLVVPFSPRLITKLRLATWLGRMYAQHRFDLEPKVERKGVEMEIKGGCLIRPAMRHMLMSGIIVRSSHASRATQGI
jgi:hypothetical protein